MKATLLLKEKFAMITEDGTTVMFAMDLYQIPEGQKKGFPEGYKFSWIAFDADNPTARILFDCHPPKGPHFHEDEDPEGEAYEWSSLSEAQIYFLKRVEKRFGRLTRRL